MAALAPSWQDVAFSDLWQNSLIRVGNRPIHYRSWSSKGVTTVDHLMKDENNFLSFSDFTDRYNIETNFLTFQGVISAVKALWKSNVANLHIGNAIHESITDTFLKMKKPNRLAYKILVSKKQKRPITTQRKWIADCMLETQENIDWKTVYRTPFLCTKITKLMVFQFKLLHRRLATNSFLTKINLMDNEQRTFCQNVKETLIHLFWTCEVSTLFWQGFKQWAINRVAREQQTHFRSSLLEPPKNSVCDLERQNDFRDVSISSPIRIRLLFFVEITRVGITWLYVGISISARKQNGGRWGEFAGPRVCQSMRYFRL